MPMELCAPNGERDRAVVRAALAQYPRIPRIREAEAAMLLRDDEAEQTQIAQPLNELRGLLRLAIPALEVLMLGSQELIDRLDHHAEDLAILVRAAADKGRAAPRGSDPPIDFSQRSSVTYSATRSITRLRTPSRPTS